MSKVVTKPIALNSNELLEVRLPKHGKFFTKKSGKDLLVFEEGNDVPIAVYEDYELRADAVDLASLPHYAELATGVATDAVVGAGAVAGTSATATGLSTMAMVGLGAVGAVAVGGAIAVASSNDSAPFVDTTAPVITSATTATAKAENSGAGQVVYTVTSIDTPDIATETTRYSLKNTDDASHFTIHPTTGTVTLTENPDFETKSTYNFTVVATDTANNVSEKAVALTVTDVLESLAGQAVIDLGDYGKLIAPVQVDGGRWYYFWDRSGEGTDFNTGALNGGVDYITHDILDSLFNHNARGVTNTTVANVDGLFGTTNDYRFATLNGINVALPTTGTGNAKATT